MPTTRPGSVMRRRQRATLITAVLAVALLAPMHRVAAAPNAPNPDGRIAYTCDRFVNPQICTVAASGTGKLVLTNAGQNFNPDWSPDGMRIAFESNRDGQF